ncbi:PRO41 protein [Xylogone sp. PMI_703]|nr:PRO41 protein [Xylogone sp. PMI_703]
MGKLVKADLARLIVLASAAYQVAAAIQGFIWPKIFWDFLTKRFDKLVQPLPILQSVNLVCGIVLLALEWPLRLLICMTLRRSLILRLFIILFAAISASFLYQATDPAIYYMLGFGTYVWAYRSGEDVPFHGG